ncbi:MAG: TetR/AcrR family transcriptional regulator C-terminal domain-containing protein [Actinomycetota bacterium]|nr:TetR/AcrR family transcriptional regulator C-terminal domain-containing protein [Actinomycetota bacterium]
MTVGATTKQASRRRQPAANPTLSRDEIARAALEFGSSEGFDQLSMRSLARVLGVTPMALYHHVANKQDLLSMLVEEVLAPIEVPDPDFGTWQERLGELQRRIKISNERYPGIDIVISEVRLTKNGERLMQGYLQILRDGGFSEREAMLGLSTIYTLAYGTSLVNRQLDAVGSQSETKRAVAESPSLAREWLRLLKDEAGREAVDRFRHSVILAGLEAIKGTLSDEVQ